MNKLFYPINFEINNIGKKLITPARIIASLIIFGLSILITIFYTIKTFFIVAETRNALGGILIMLLTIYVTYIIIVRVCLREKKLMQYYQMVKNYQNTPVFDLLNIVDMDKSTRGVPIYICSTGMRLIGFRVFPDSIIGKTSAEQVELHYDSLKKLLGQLAINFHTCWCLYLTSSTGVDKRWEDLISANVKNPCPVIKQIVNSLIIYNQGIKDNLIHEYYFVIEPINSRPASKMVEAVLDCTAYTYEGYNVGFEFIDENHMTRVLEQVYTTDKSFMDLKTGLDIEKNKDEIAFVQISQVIKNDGTVIDLSNIQGGTIRDAE